MTEQDPRRRGHPVADAIGAMFRGAYEGDKHVRSRMRGWLAFMLSGGLALWMSTEAWNLGKRAIERSWSKSDEQQAALVAALKDQTTAIDNLVWTMWESNANGDAAHRAMMKAMKVPPPPPVQRPERPPQQRQDLDGGGG